MSEPGIEAGIQMDAYLRRVGLPAAPRADEAGLRALHVAQAHSIPFENLDPLLGRAVAIDEASLRRKLLEQRRGGYCFELNGLLGHALRRLGFEHRPRLARVLLGKAEPGPRTHVLHEVRLGGRSWLADVGFGGPGLRAPIPLEIGREDRQEDDRFRLRADESLGTVLEQRRGDDAWVDLYAWADESVLPIDLEVSNHFTSTWPGSIFRQHLLCARPSPRGRATVLDRALNAHGDKKELKTPGEMLAALREHLGIELADADTPEFRAAWSARWDRLPTTPEA